MTGQLSGSVFKTKCDKRKHLQKNINYFLLFKKKGYLNSGSFFTLVQGGYLAQFE